jgi:nucleotide-binding universal stress UspA family protein
MSVPTIELPVPGAVPAQAGWASETWTTPEAQPARLRSILVALDPGGPVSGLLEQAIGLAVRDRARLTLLSVVPEPPATLWLAPLLVEDPRRANEADCQRLLCTAVRAVPVTVPVTTVLGRGRRSDALLRELRRGGHDLLLVSGGRAARIVRSLNRRSAVPVLVLGTAQEGV